METYIAELETSKANLECSKTNDDNYKQQIRTLKKRMVELEDRANNMTVIQQELLVKLEESEEERKKNMRLEESNLDYERKIISLEGTIEQLEMECKNTETLIADLRQSEEVYKMNHTVNVECLNGKISTLENEIKDLELTKSKNEATIFGLETQISNLNCTIDKLRMERNETEATANEVKNRLEQIENACKLHNETITGLDMQLGELQNI